MKKEYIIGTDIGTSGCKSILVDNYGNVIASAMQEYPLYTPHAGWAEQNPLDWWEATLSTLTQIVKNNPETLDLIKGIGLSGQMHGLVALDKNYQIIRPAFLWNDQRTSKQCQEILDAVGGEKELIKYTNNSMLPGYTGGKILWLKEEEPYNYEKAIIFLNPKDYIRYKLTNQIATEVSDASGTGLFDVKNRKWNEDLLSILNIPKNFLPVCYESPVISGYITKEVSLKTGLPKGIAVTGGGGDAVIQTTGTGLIKEGILGLTLGTAGIISMGLNSFQFNSTGRLQIFCNNAPDTWNIMGVTLAAGGSYQWFKNVLCKYEIKQSKTSGKDVYAIMDEAVIKNSMPGSKNLIFLPYLSGERCPYADPNARSAFIGLTLRHNHEDMARSVMEGVTFSAKQVYELITVMDPRLKVSEVRVSGGGSGSILWRQIVSDIFQLPVKTVSGSKEGGAYGAVMVAGTGCGVWPSLSEAASVLKIETECLPNSENKNIYDDLYGAYKTLYPTLKSTFDKLSGMKV
ncbi:MAG: xylulokinase [Candidatus Humimicrobiaceae bacterium]